MKAYRTIRYRLHPQKRARDWSAYLVYEMEQESALPHVPSKVGVDLQRRPDRPVGRDNLPLPECRETGSKEATLSKDDGTAGQREQEGEAQGIRALFEGPSVTPKGAGAGRPGAHQLVSSCFKGESQDTKQFSLCQMRSSGQCGINAALNIPACKASNGYRAYRADGI